MIIVKMHKKSFWFRVKRFFMAPLLFLRNWIVKKLLAFRAKLQIHSLREAIGLADKDKEKTGRKNMVVFNTVSGKYEPIQKKVLKKAASAKKQDAARNGYRVQKAVKKTSIKTEQVKKIEEKSLYVTK